MYKRMKMFAASCSFIAFAFFYSVYVRESGKTFFHTFNIAAWALVLLANARGLSLKGMHLGLPLAVLDYIFLAAKFDSIRHFTFSETIVNSVHNILFAVFIDAHLSFNNLLLGFAVMLSALAFDKILTTVGPSNHSVLYYAELISIFTRWFINMVNRNEIKCNRALLVFLITLAGACLAFQQTGAELLSFRTACAESPSLFFAFVLYLVFAFQLSAIQSVDYVDATIFALLSSVATFAIACFEYTAYPVWVPYLYFIGHYFGAYLLFLALQLYALSISPKTLSESEQQEARSRQGEDASVATEEPVAAQ
ncbi:hypothetical protein PAPHI01_0844 [Pancytospora philotis]|nr:hypothetical protein PAPHI01_0844 [Pancytospora philotis]